MDVGVDEVLSQAESGKERATSHRNRERYDQAVKILMDISDQLSRCLEEQNRQLNTSDEDKKRLRSSLADTFGMIGGVYRRKKDLATALQFYEKGLALEEMDDASTYNLVNTISLAITEKKMDPLSPPLKQRIARVLKELLAKTGSSDGARGDEWWAWADLAQFQLLSGNEREAKNSIANGLSQNPDPENVRRSTMLSEQLAKGLPTSSSNIAASIRDLIARLNTYIESTASQ